MILREEKNFVSKGKILGKISTFKENIVKKKFSTSILKNKT